MTTGSRCHAWRKLHDSSKTIVETTRTLAEHCASPRAQREAEAFVEQKHGFVGCSPYGHTRCSSIRDRSLPQWWWRPRATRHRRDRITFVPGSECTRQEEEWEVAQRGERSRAR